MLEELSPIEFEVWCKTLLERRFHCRVEETPAVGDEGRDLIIHSDDGLAVVECKHYPRGTVGRPVVQKLHSAILTAGARRGIVMTTGRFSAAAQTYAEQLTDVEIELLDGSKLDYFASTLGITGRQAYVRDGTSLAVRTTPEHAFQKMIAHRIFSEPRFSHGVHEPPAVHVTRSTAYEGAYVASFRARGETQTARGTAAEEWEGRVWASLDGTRIEHGEHPLSSWHRTSLAALGEVLTESPGQTAPPSLQPHEVQAKMRGFVVESLSKTINYRGRNNVSYTKEIRPNFRETQVDNVHLLYVPMQEVEISTEKSRFVGDVRESRGDFEVKSSQLNFCTICRREFKDSRHVVCAECHQPAHTKSFLHPDSDRCTSCSATLCRHHVRRHEKVSYCTACAPAGSAPAPPRNAPHAAIGAGASVAAVVSEVVVPGAQYALTAVGVIGAWLPFLYVSVHGHAGKASRWLRY